MRRSTVVAVVLALVVPTLEVPALRTRAWAAPQASDPERLGFFGAAGESLTGDVYAEPTRWRPLSLGTFFTEGWDQAWASPVNGTGGAPRQGWIGAFDGVFYRLGIATYSFAEHWGESGEQHLGSLTVYTPLSRRLEIRQDIPFVVNNRGANGRYHTDFGDYSVGPRFLLSESEGFTQSLGVAFRTPTGSDRNGNGAAAITPDYEFWANAWNVPLVVRGGVAMFAPSGNDTFDEAGARNAFSANLAAGYYFTAHDRIPFGDLVLSVGTTLSQLTDDRGPSTTTLLFTPAFRTHLGANFYLLGGIDLPATNPDPFDYQTTVGLMKVF
jgi:hypothetical protein